MCLQNGETNAHCSFNARLQNNLEKIVWYTGRNLDKQRLFIFPFWYWKRWVLATKRKRRYCGDVLSSLFYGSWLMRNDMVYKDRRLDITLLWDSVLFLALVWSKVEGVFHDAWISDFIRWK